MKYIAMAGLHGCLPQFASECDSFGEAVEVLADIHELGPNRTAHLRRDGYLELSLHRDGNEYCEISQEE